ncbi:MAG: MFS transporter [bacterium]
MGKLFHKLFFENRRLSRLEVLRSQRLFTVEGSLATIVGTLCWGIFVIGFALHLGASQFQIGILAALPAFANVFQIFSSYFVERLNRRKLYVWSLAIVHRLLLSLLVLIPLVFPPSLSVLVLLIVVFISFSSASISSPAVNKWLSDLVPLEARGKYFGRRNTIMALVGTSLGLVAGRTLDIFPGYRGFLIVYMAGFVFAIMNLASFLLIQEPPIRGEIKRVEFKELFTKPPQNKVFMRFVLYFMLWAFANGLSAPYYSVFMIQRLKLSYTLITILGAVSALMTILSYRLWGYLGDRFSNKAVLEMGCFAIMVLAFLWIFNSPNRYFFVPVIHFFGGLFNAAVALSSFNMLLEVSPEENKSVYIGFFATSTGIVGAVAPILGGGVVTYFSRFSMDLWGFQFGNLQIVFFLTGLLLLLGNFLLLGRLRGAKGTSAFQLLRQLRTYNPLGLGINLYLYTHSTNVDRRIAAGRRLSKLRSPLAVDALVRALDDPDPRVRREAALALGEMKDRSAVDALIEKLDSPEADIETEAALALGKLRDPRSVEHLLKKLEGKDAELKLRSIDALGEIGDRTVRDKLFRMLLAEPQESKEFLVLLDALGKLKDERIVEFGFSLLRESRSRLVRNQILNSIAEIIDERRRFYRFASLDEYEQDAEMLKLVNQSRGVLSSLRRFIPEDEFRAAGERIEGAVDCIGREKYAEIISQLNRVIPVVVKRYLERLKKEEEGERDKVPEAEIEQPLSLCSYFILNQGEIEFSREEVMLFIIAFRQILLRCRDALEG